MNAEQMRRNAKYCLDRARVAADDTKRNGFVKAAQGWRSLAYIKHQADCALLPEEYVADRKETPNALTFLAEKKK
jgi:hypothetical protein